MKKPKIYIILLLLFMTFTMAGTSPASAVTTVKGQYLDNATFLTHNYVKYTSFVNLVSDLADKMNNTYKVNYFFPNTGLFDASGTIVNASTELVKVKDFLNAIQVYESAHGMQFKVMAWLSADSGTVDVTNATVRAAIVNECMKLTSTSTAGSYVSGANRTFDGVMLDLEPSGNDDTRFNAYKQLMDDVKSGIGSSKLTGVATHKLGTGSTWFWSPSYYYYMGRHVDIITAMTYDSGSTSGSDFQTWMQQQTVGILQAVSGRTWNNDANHPAPINGIKVFMGQPAFPDKPTSGHNSAYENLSYGLPGLDAGITTLKNDSSDGSDKYFHGTAMYLHTDGSGNDNYAGWNTGWWEWGHSWLGSW